MRKLELSEVNSNLLLFTSVALSVTPFLLGDQLQFVVDALLRDGVIAFDEFWNYLSRLVS
ncbi:MAG TPA: hypothetical protein VF074_24030 [Pyrinomonadaceae bacterium]